MPAPFRVMGVLNVTPDSFSDGGSFLAVEDALAHAHALVADGADIIDVGGESTRPGAQPVAADEELDRVRPVLEGIAAEQLDAQISIDTSKAAVAAAAIACGATLVNDVSALRADPEMAAVVAGAQVDCCLMHMLGQPRTMQDEPRYGDVVDEVRAFLEERLSFAVASGIREERLLLDPGIGFGKTVAHNLELIERLHELTTLGRPLLIGTSRKSFIARVAAEHAAGTGEHEAGEGPRRAVTGPPTTGPRLGGTLATCVLAFERGAEVFRVHDVAAVREALAVAAATLGGRCTASATARSRTT